MNFLPSRSDSEDEINEETAAEAFARTLHDTWGVGHETSVGGTGVLIFLSVDDRVLYISRGGALDRILTDSRTDQIIREVQPALKQAKYAEGLIEAVEYAVDFIHKGEPTWKEIIWEFLQMQYLIISLWLYIFFGGLWRARKQRREGRAYAQAASQLTELDRTQAEALQGRYQATSCPICLENFKSSTVGSDDQPIKLLRCGHVFDESCWSEWVNSGQGNVRKCPICKKDVGPQNSPELDHTQLAQNIAEDGREDQDRVIRRFQQERNFRLLRLGGRFPRYINPNQIQRWSSPTYNGSLVRDQSFVQNNPRVVHRSTDGGGSGGSGGSSASFGGGMSSGGRGGRF
jgi:uncharacterized membrane protein YgcG